MSLITTLDSYSEKKKKKKKKKGITYHNKLKSNIRKIYTERLKRVKYKKRKQNATNNGTAYFYCEIKLQNKKLQSRSNQVQNLYRQIKPQFAKC